MNKPAEPRRYLIAVGSPESPDHAPLAHVANDLERITQLFCSPVQGYERVLDQEIPLGAPAQTIRTAIADWFRNPERRASDIVLMYFSGHGGNAGQAGKYYLFTSDSQRRDLPASAINIAEFVGHLYESDDESARPQNLLLVLDACNASSGAGQSLAALAALRGSGFFREGSGLWFVAAADPLSEAADGAFVNALASVLDDPAWAPRGGSRYLNPLEVMVTAVNAHFDAIGHVQHAEGDVFAASEAHAFIRNPHFAPQLDGLPLLDEAHWDPKGRGVEGMSAQGWYFTGRVTVLRELSAFLRDLAPAKKAWVVTGAPGSGKSSVLGRLVLCSHPRKRQQMLDAGILEAGDASVPPVHAVAAHVHARGLSKDEIAASLARQLGCADTSMQALLGCLQGATHVTGIVVDALDESTDPFDIEIHLLRPLAEAPATRLIVGTRRFGNGMPLDGAAQVSDLDDVRYFSRQDMEQYVLRRLLEWEPATVYRDATRHKDAAQLARLVSERAGVSFLFTRLVTRALAESKQPIDTGRPDWRAGVEMPRDLSRAFEFDLRRFATDERQRIIDILLPLAYARGKGLPFKNVWPAATSAICGKEYTNGDIRSVRELAGYYIVQDTDHGDVVYRLFHQAFADYLKQLAIGEEVDAAICRALHAASSLHAPADWARLHEPYTQHHLAAHAATANLLAPLVRDPGFLIHMPPEAVLPHLTKLGSSADSRIADIYRRVAHHMRAPDVAERASYLHFAALQDGHLEFAAAIASLVPSYHWRTRWTRWAKLVPGEVAVELNEPISDIALHRCSAETTLAAVAAAGVIQLWELPVQRILAESESFDGKLSHLFITEVDGAAWIIAAWTESLNDDAVGGPFGLTLRVFNPSLRHVHAQTHLPARTWPGNNVACITQDNESAPMIAVAVDAHVVLRSLPSLEEAGEIDTSPWTAVRQMTFAGDGTDRKLAAVFDACDAKAWNPAGIVTRIWNVSTRAPMAEHAFRSRGSPIGLAAVAFGEDRLFVVMYNHPPVLEILDVATGRLRMSCEARVFRMTGAVEQDGRVFLCGQQDGRFAYGYIERDANGALACDLRLTPVEVAQTGLTAPIWIHERLVVANIHASRQLRLWDIDEIAASVPAPQPLQPGWNDGISHYTPDDAKLMAAVADVDSGLVFACTQTGRVDALDVGSGRLRWSVSIAPRIGIECVSLGSIKGQRVLLVAADGVLHFFELDSGREARALMPVGERVRSMAFQIIGGAELCFVASRVEGDEYGVRIFDLASSDAASPSDHGNRDRFMKIDAYSDKVIEAVAVRPTDPSHAEVLLAGPFSFVQRKNWPRFAPGDKLDMYEPLLNSYVKSLAVGTLAGRQAVAAGNENGLLVIWDLERGKDAVRRELAHEGAVTAIAFTNALPGIAVATGGANRLCLWSSALRKVAEIDFRSRIIALGQVSATDIFIATAHGVAIIEFRR